MAPAWQKAAVGAAITSYAGWKYIDGKLGISKDLAVLKGASAAMKKTGRLMKNPNATIVTSWNETIAEPGTLDRAMMIQAETGRTVTFRDIEELSNRIGHWALAQGFKAGESVSLMMDNRPEYIAAWLGFAKAGMVTALINTNQKGKPLIHAITTVNSVATVLGTEYSEVVASVVDELRQGGVRHFSSFGSGSITSGTDKPAFCDASLDEALTSFPSTPVDESQRASIKLTSPCYYIYTSGTTGLPKACNMSHGKLFGLTSLSAMAGVKTGDVIYGSGLPMYHSAANLGIMHAVNLGGTYVVRVKFSASKQWEECAKYNCVAMQYIGELCRYLLTQSDGTSEKSHKLRVAFGNGLRPEIWDQFQRRFNVPEILEFYGATEGAGILVNYCQNYEGQGAVGRLGPIMKNIMPATIVKFDVENERPLRDPKTGFCIPAANNEAGELINPIKTMPGGGKNFEGYTNKEATEKKLLRDVFIKGDTYYRSGDLLRRDAKGYFYFVDRIGDTFRWKGENVSTMEVSEVISGYEGVVDANVYGAQVPGQDGRACMVALTLEEGQELDATHFATYCRANLPPYSVPLFLRLLKHDINITGTFKHQKVDYRNQGCDPNKITDELLWFNNQSGVYESYGPEQYSLLSAGRSKL